MRHYVVSKTPKREEDRLRKSPNGFRATTKLLGASKTIQSEREKERARPPILTVYRRDGDLIHFCGTKLVPLGGGNFHCAKHLETVHVHPFAGPYILDEKSWEVSHEMSGLRMQPADALRAL